MQPVVWSAEDEARFRALFPITPNRQLAKIFNLAGQTIAERGCKRGLKKSRGHTGRSVPIGTPGIDPFGYRIVKTSEGGGSKAWRKLHHIVWEANNGPIPKGCRIAFKDRKKLNCDITNLEMIDRVEQMKRNTIHNYPPPVKDAIRLLAKLNRLIDEKQDNRPSQSPL